MEFYILLFALILITVLKFPRSTALGCFWMMVLCFLSMFRGKDVGTDTANYLDIYGGMESYLSLSFTGSIGRNLELLFSMLVKSVAYCGLPSRVIVASMSSVTFLFLFLALRRFKASLSFGTLMFVLTYYLSSLNIARQICADSIVLYAFTFIIENISKKNILKYVFWVLLATLIHASSIVFIGLVFLFFIKASFFSKRKLIAIALILFLINSVSPFNLSSIILKFLGTDSSYAAHYSERAVTFGRSIWGLLEDFTLLISLLWIFKKYVNTKLNLSDLIFYFSIIITFLSSNLQADISRIFYPIIMFQILYLSKMIYERKMSVKSLPLLLFVFVKTFFCLLSVSEGVGGIVPYVISFN